MTTSTAQRALTVGSDLTLCGGFVAVSIAVVVELGNVWLPVGFVIALGIWTGAATVLALPAVALLYASRPRLPLSERNALYSSAIWFGRAVWASAVFAFSIVLGSIAGIVASRISNSHHNLVAALQDSFVAVSQVALWPILLIVASIAYIVMGVRWLRDVGYFVETGEAAKMGALLETRWLGPLGGLHKHTLGRSVLRFLVTSLAGRIGLFITWVTVGLSIAFAIRTLTHR